MQWIHDIIRFIVYPITGAEILHVWKKRGINIDELRMNCRISGITTVCCLNKDDIKPTQIFWSDHKTLEAVERREFPQTTGENVTNDNTECHLTKYSWMIFIWYLLAKRLGLGGFHMFLLHFIGMQYIRGFCSFVKSCCQIRVSTNGLDTFPMEILNQWKEYRIDHKLWKQNDHLKLFWWR